MYYPCSENKDADQLRGYREADLRLCFRPCKLLVFSRTGSNVSPICFLSLLNFAFFFFSTCPALACLIHQCESDCASTF